MGKSTYLEIYTPDKDGIMRDANGITGQKNSMICKFTVLNGYELAKDVQSAIEDSSKNCVLVSAKPMRK